MGLISDAYVLLAARVVLGCVMIHFGWPKIRDLRKNASDFVAMGFRPGLFWGSIIAFSEFFGGSLLVLGIYPELFAALFAFQMLLGTFWKLKIKKPFSDYSYDILALIISLFIVMYGGGVFTLLPFTAFELLRVDLVILGFTGALLGVGLSRPKMN